MTPNGSFFGPENVFNRFLVKNRPNAPTFMKIAPATFFQRTVGLVLSYNKCAKDTANQISGKRLGMALLIFPNSS
jgi:hypothetical protein